MHTLTPIDFGTLYVVVNAILLLFALVFDRHYIGIATFINLFLLGYVVEFSQNMMFLLFPTPTIGIRIIAFSCGFIALCFGSSLYKIADMGELDENTQRQIEDLGRTMKFLVQQK